MWTVNDASSIGASDMDMRGCPSYEAGFDACDPLGSVLGWSGRGPARVLRRRCRSEGVDRSPYEHAPVQRSVDGNPRNNSNNKALPNKSHFTLNTAYENRVAQYNKECSLPIAENGDYIMAKNQKIYQSYQPGRPKLIKTSPNRPLIVSALSSPKLEESRLPKVEELLEKIDDDMMEVPHVVAKQPLKSILNNPLPKSPPPGILKKPKNRSYQDTKDHNAHNPDGRRRQRAASESDNLFCNYHLGSTIPGYESRVTSNLKRAKDNSGTGYSYGSAFATLNTSSPSKKTTSRNYKCYSAPPPQNKDEYHPNVHILRTTAINNEKMKEEPSIEFPREDSPLPTCPALSPELPVSAVTVSPKKKIIKPVKKKSPTKPRSPKMKSKVDDSCPEDGEPDDSHRSSSPTPDLGSEFWHMETDAVVAEIEKIENGHKLAIKDHVVAPVPPPKKDKTELPPQPTVIKSPAKPAATTKRAPSKENIEMFLTALHTTNPFRNMPARKGGLEDTELYSIIKSVHVMCNAILGPKEIHRYSPMHLPDSIASCLRPSLFPRVPPYLKFINHDETPSLKIPLAIQKHLKWKLTSITPIVVKKTLTNSGFRLVKSECDTSECPQEETIDWVGIWGKHMKSLMFRGIKDGQKMNHFPGTFQIGRKDRLWRNLQKLVAKHGIKEFGIMPKTYVLPYDLKLLKMDWEKHVENDERWIIKPPASARGTGIKVVSRWTQIPKKRSVVVQRYVSKPYLINGSKFDMRLYVLVTSVHPLRIYLYKDGLARFASVKYNDEITSLNDRYMHLTNYSINRLSKNYTPNEDFSACEGHKWTLQALFQYLRTEKKVNTKALWESMKDLVIKTIISGEASISSLTKANLTSRYNCYELFGIDVLLDEDLKPWLLEVNISPSLHSASPLDIHVKGPMVTETLNIAQYQIPNKINVEALSKDKPHKMSGLPYDSRLYTIYLSKEERDKHIIYTNMEDREMYLRDILSTLTPDDVRHLIQAEDELTQAGDMERVFPTINTHKYLNFLTGPRYYNRLFDAWETRYTANRQSGLELLRNLCEIGYHLEVPPVPLKNDVDAPSPAASEQPSVHSVPSVEPSPCPSTTSAARTCGDSIAHPPVPQAIEPRA
ncbi:tubulin-tyrosine ligase family domain-containing protein [Phthorimaea operculella]|nr:tubulin-tyrosine ligase family domain-containing protein [Phthorimaea operculella]